MAGSFITEDLDTMFDDEEFAVTGTIGTNLLDVIFDRAYIELHGMVSGANPIALAKASDTSAVVGTTITIEGTAWTIRDRQPQDDGKTVLLQLEG